MLKPHQWTYFPLEKPRFWTVSVTRSLLARKGIEKTIRLQVDCTRSQLPSSGMAVMFRGSTSDEAWTKAKSVEYKVCA